MRGDAAGVVGGAAESDVQVVNVSGGVLHEGCAAADGVLDLALELGRRGALLACRSAQGGLQGPVEEDVLHGAAAGEGLDQLPGGGPVDLARRRAAEVGAAVDTAAAVMPAADR